MNNNLTNHFMKYLIWILGLSIIGGTIYFNFFDQRADQPVPDNSPVVVDEQPIEDNESTSQPQDDVSQDEEINTDFSAFEPADKNLLTFKNERFGFAFDYNDNYYWDSTQNDYSVSITNSKELNEFSYQGYIPDNDKAFRIFFNATKSDLAAYLTANITNDDSRQVETSDFKAMNITGHEYYIHEDKAQPLSGVNYPVRIILFSHSGYVYSFLTDGNDVLRDQIIKTFRVF